jgi:hypothetical protein
MCAHPYGTPHAAPHVPLPCPICHSSDDVYYDKDANYIVPTDSFYFQRIRSIDSLYLVAGIIHLVNAFQYIYAWFPLGFGIFTWVMIPEWLNVIGASLYLVGASQYDVAYRSEGVLQKNHVIETVASAVEVGAAFGWTWVWWVTHVRGAGRGLTLDDPDFTGNALIIIPSIMYLVYNVNNLRDPENYRSGPNASLYQTADLWYAVGSVVYLLSALRDDGWFSSFGVFGGAASGVLARLPGGGRADAWLRADAGERGEAKPLMGGAAGHQLYPVARDGGGAAWPVTGPSWQPFSDYNRGEIAAL